MNERTKKLAIIANPSSQEIYESDSWQFNCAAWSADDLEKFAELIVREMLHTCEDHPAWTGRMIGEEIKQHFGVEE